jgi:Ricin-type beta-trefoil lectin domain
MATGEMGPWPVTPSMSTVAGKETRRPAEHRSSASEPHGAALASPDCAGKVQQRQVTVLNERKETMNLRRVKLITLVMSAVIASSMLLATPALAVTPASTSSATISSDLRPAVNPNPSTCHFFRVLFGHWFAVDAYVNRSLAWTAHSHRSGSQISLAHYTDSLTQCWKLLGGFGNGEFELTLAHSGACLTAAGAGRSPGDPMIIFPCRSQRNQLWKSFISRSGRIEFQSVRSALCVTGRSGITSGSLLVQESCSTFDNAQSWTLNINP